MERHLQMARPRPKPNHPVIFEEYYDYADAPPEEFELEDVELIWWAVASRYSKKEIRKKLQQIMDKYVHSGCFQYVPVADSECRGRYPRGIIRTLTQVLKPYKLMPRFHRRGVLCFCIQLDVWHICIYEALEWCPAKALPRHLRVRKLEDDIGL